MQKLCKRALALLLVLVLVLTQIPGAYAAPDRNDGIRHQTCTTLSAQAEAYYTDSYAWDSLILLEGDTTGSSLAATRTPLYEALQELMSSTQTGSVTYKDLTSYWPYTDTQPGFADATLFYSDAVGTGYNREHVWPKSRASFYQSGGGADLHHLRPTNSSVNSTRSNYTMGNVKANCSTYSTAEYGGKTVLWYNADADLVEVNDNIKGDVARILLYVYVRWGQPNLFENVQADSLPPFDSDDSQNNGLKVMDNLETLLQWCREDPVDDWEMARNDRVQDVQGNRNVFIDYPELAWLLFGQPLPTDMPTPSGEAANPADPDYPITVQSNNADWGTVTIAGSRITAVPAEGYYAAGAEVSPEGAATVTQNGTIFLVSQVKEAATVTIQFAPKTPATLIYAVPEGVAVTSPTETGFVGDPMVLPEVTGAPAQTEIPYSFVGWVEAPVTATSDLSSLTVYSPGSFYTPTQSSTVLYALYSYLEEDGAGEANTFRQLSEAPADWSGEYVMTGLVAESGGEFVHLATGENVGKAGAAILLSQAGITKRDGILSDVTADYVISISRLPNGNYSMQLKGSQSPCYLSYSGSGNSLGTADNADGAGAQWTFAMQGDAVVVSSVGTPGRYLQFNTTATMFRCYTGSQTPVYLYAAAGSTATYYLTLSGDPCAEGHTPELRGAKEPTCTETGYTGDTFCSVCSQLLEAGTEIPALGHAWSEWTVTRTATCFRDGIQQHACTRCGISEETSLPADPKYCPSEAFSDVDTHRWYHQGLDFVLSQGLMNGVGGGRFQPDGTLTRGQMVTILYRLAGSPEASGQTPFTDVATGRFYTNAVVWAYDSNIVKGVTDTAFAPDAAVTREQLVTFLARYARWEGRGTAVAGNLENFPDAAQVSNYAVVPMIWAVENGILNGIDGRLAPQNTATRAQIAAILQRYCK